MKKLLSVVLITLMCFSLAACGNNSAKTDPAGDNTENTGKQDPAEGETTELVWAIKTWGTTPADMDKVEDAINAYLIDKLNIKVSILPIGIADWTEKMNVMLTSPNEPLDLVAMSGDQFASYVSKGQIIALDDLLAEYGPSITEVLGDFLSAGQSNGVQYAVPTIKDEAGGTGFLILQDAVDKYNIDLSSVTSLPAIEPILAALKAAEPNIYPLALAKVISTVTLSMNYDPLGNDFGVLMDVVNGGNVINLFETDEYADYCKLMRKWYLAGYIAPDAATIEDNNSTQLKAGTAIAQTSKTKPGLVDEQSTIIGKKVANVEYRKPIATTSTVQSAMWGIANNSTHPKEAMQLLELLYSDEYLINLICNGIEGVHYVKNADGTLSYPEGISAETSPYNLNMSWEMGNQYLSYIWEGTDPTLYQQLKEFNETAIKSIALGFVFDQSKVATEVSACTSVVSQYKLALETGSVDTDTVLPEFIEKLKRAGIDTIISEKQSQLDAWLAAK